VDHEFGQRDCRRVFAVADTELAQGAFERLCENRNVPSRRVVLTGNPKRSALNMTASITEALSNPL
jgi:hypothetical protein